MIHSYQFVLKRIFLALLSVAALLVIYFFHISPVAFQKSVTIKPYEAPELFQPASANGYVDIAPLLERIPYKDGVAVYDVYPPDRFHKTIEQGFGNCSNLAFGMAVYLNRNNYEYQVVHFLPYDGFLQGIGHSILNMPYKFDGKLQVGLVDMLEGGLPMESGKFLKIETLQKKNLKDVAILPLNALKDSASDYYGDFLNRSAIGVVKSDEIRTYFGFISKFYFPISNNKQIERIFYQGLGIVFGVFPSTYVSAVEYDRLFPGRQFVLLAAKSLLWLARILMLMTLILIISTAGSACSRALGGRQQTGSSRFNRYSE